MSKKVAVLYSSGIESSAILGKFLADNYMVYPIYVQGGFQYEADEMDWAKKLWDYYHASYPNQLKSIQFLDLNWDYGRDNSIPISKKQLIIPLRNMVMFSMAAIYMKRNDINTLAAGILGDENFPDTSMDYLTRLQALISEGGQMDFRIELPFYGKQKADVIRENYDLVPFGMTRSCTTMQNGLHCGKCSKCISRHKAFEDSGKMDPTKYLKKQAA